MIMSNSVMSNRIKAPQLYYVTMVKHKWKYVLAYIIIIIIIIIDNRGLNARWCLTPFRYGRRGTTFSVSLSAVGFLSIESFCTILH